MRTPWSGAITTTAAGIDAITLTDIKRFTLKNFNIGDATALDIDRASRFGGDGIQITASRRARAAPTVWRSTT